MTYKNIIIINNKFILIEKISKMIISQEKRTSFSRICKDSYLGSL